MSQPDQIYKVYEKRWGILSPVQKDVVFFLRSNVAELIENCKHVPKMIEIRLLLVIISQ